MFSATITVGATRVYLSLPLAEIRRTDASASRRPLALAAGIGAAFLVFYAAWLAIEPGGKHALLVFTDTAYLVPIAAACALATIASGRGPPALRGFWTFVALANGAWLGGEILWSIRELGTGKVPFPWWTDATYLAFYVLIGIAIWRTFRPQLHAVGSARLIDAGLAVGTLALLWWYVVLSPLPLGGDLGSIVALAGPVFALLLLGLLVATRLLPSRHGTLGTSLVAWGLACGTLTDGVYTHAVLTHGYVSGQWTELGWQTEAMLYALGALVAALGFDARGDWTRLGRMPHRSAGALALLAALASAITLGLSSAHGRLATLVAAALLLLLSVTRLGLLLPTRSRRPVTDSLPGRYGPLAFQDCLADFIHRAGFLDSSFALLLVDGDHVAASAVVPRRSTVVELAVGSAALLVPDVGADEADALAARLRAVSSDPRPVLGLAVAAPGEPLESVLGRARVALAVERLIDSASGP